MAEIDPKYFAADLSAEDLVKVVSAHPVIFWGGLAVVAVICIWYGVKYFTGKKEAN